VRGAAHVWPEAPRAVGNALEVAAEVEWPFRVSRALKPRRQRVWFRLPADVPVSAGAAADAFLLATVFGAMRLSRGLCLHATASEDLVTNLLRLQALWRERRPDKYREAEIRCDGLAAGASPAGPPVLCFSGGLDPAYSLYRHTRPGAGGVGAAVMLAGADIPLSEEAAFSEAFARSRRMTDSLGVPLLRVSTNLRAVKQKWPHSVTAGLAAVLTLFRGRFGSGLVAVGFTREEARRWWPQDETDPPLVSCRAFPIVGDGYEADRFEKLEALRDWPEALDNLRVCYRPGSWTENCGQCLKCSTLLLFARIAFRRRLACLPREATVEDVRSLATCEDPNGRLRLAQVARHARALGVTEPWMDELDRAVRAAGIAVPAPGSTATGAEELRA